MAIIYSADGLLVEDEAQSYRWCLGRQIDIDDGIMISTCEHDSLTMTKAQFAAMCRAVLPIVEADLQRDRGGG